MSETNEILIGADRAAGLITINRPSTGNALTTGMRIKIAAAFPRWARDPEIYAVVIRSVPEPAFCLGRDLGELSSLAQSCMFDVGRALADEYALNWQLECFTKPTVSLIDGTVAGSGIGITAYGTHRVAGERYEFAVRAIRIGQIPDNGVSWLLARLPHNIGMYLALTGRSIGRGDAHWLGLVTHCIPAAHVDEVQTALASADPVDPVVDGRHEPQEPGELQEHAHTIGACFSADTVEEILTRLATWKGQHAIWCQNVLGDLSRWAPTSLKVTHRLVRLARSFDLSAALACDYRIASRYIAQHDFYEGIRSEAIDGGAPPVWQPAHLDEVSEAAIEQYFSSLKTGELKLASRSEMQAVEV